MDETDRGLITLLRANARTPVASLAKTLKVSRGTVQNRIDRMHARGDIGGFTIRVPDQSERVRAIMAIAVEGEQVQGPGAPPTAAGFRRSGRYT